MTDDTTFAREGAVLYALDQGEGTPLVFLHGGLADHRAALMYVGALAGARRVITPDMRGSGRSCYAGALDWGLLAADVAGLLDHLGIERAFVGGTSAGSAVAARFALDFPERLLGLVFVSPVYAGHWNDAQRAAFAKMDEAGQRTLAEGIEALRPLYAALPDPIRGAAIEMMLGFDPASVAATTRFLASCAAPFEGLEALARIDAPALVIPGTDPEHPVEVAALYAEHLRRATTAEPATMVAAIEAFTR
ncbi:MAG: alpha/beta fold hydrolase [Deltaproteobacteria bacterium]|jgi:3-oxoadipate enol-lactonase